MSSQPTFSPVEGARLISLGERAVVVLPRALLSLTLNSTAAWLWERCPGASVAELVARLVDEFDLSLDEARRDVDAWATELIDAGALKLS
jgi:Coenzyme PQQ synthesis protein D (PqqD)